MNTLPFMNVNKIPFICGKCPICKTEYFNYKTKNTKLLDVFIASSKNVHIRLSRKCPECKKIYVEEYNAVLTGYYIDDKEHVLNGD